MAPDVLSHADALALLSEQRIDDPELDAWFDGFDHRVPAPAFASHTPPIRATGMASTLLWWLALSATLAEAPDIAIFPAAKDAEGARREFATIRAARGLEYVAAQLEVRATLSVVRGHSPGVAFGRLLHISHCLRDRHPDALVPTLESLLTWLESGTAIFLMGLASLQLEEAILCIITLAHDLRHCEEKLGIPRAESWANAWLERAWPRLLAAAALELP